MYSLPSLSSTRRNLRVFFLVYFPSSCLFMPYVHRASYFCLVPPALTYGHHSVFVLTSPTILFSTEPDHVIRACPFVNSLHTTKSTMAGVRFLSVPLMLYCHVNFLLSICFRWEHSRICSQRCISRSFQASWYFIRCCHLYCFQPLQRSHIPLPYPPPHSRFGKIAVIRIHILNPSI